VYLVIVDMCAFQQPPQQQFLLRDKRAQKAKQNKPQRGARPACSNEGAAKASRTTDDAAYLGKCYNNTLEKCAFAYALQLEADLWQKRVQEADVDAALADKDDDEGAEVGVQHGAAAGV
jgi:hypothetical protein